MTNNLNFIKEDLSVNEAYGTAGLENFMFIFLLFKKVFNLLLASCFLLLASCFLLRSIF